MSRLFCFREPVGIEQPQTFPTLVLFFQAECELGHESVLAHDVVCCSTLTKFVPMLQPRPSEACYKATPGTYFANRAMDCCLE